MNGFDEDCSAVFAEASTRCCWRMRLLLLVLQPNLRLIALMAKESLERTSTVENKIATKAKYSIEQKLDDNMAECVWIERTTLRAAPACELCESVRENNAKAVLQSTREVQAVIDCSGQIDLLCQESKWIVGGRR